jgi:dTDP-4-amino-4,6-dideoxygalactose transaminase
VIATHIYGNSPDVAALREGVDSFGAALIEDAALRIADPNEVTQAHATIYSYGRGKGLAIGCGGRLKIHEPEVIPPPRTRVPSRSSSQFSRVLAYSKPIWWAQSQLVGLIRQHPPPGEAKLDGPGSTGESASPLVARMISSAVQFESTAGGATHRRGIDHIYRTQIRESERVRRLSGDLASGLTPGFATLVEDRGRTWRRLKEHRIDASTAFSYCVGAEASNRSFPVGESIAATILVLPNHSRVTPKLAETISEIVSSG